ncbi:MAG: hypothetical protein HDS83_00100 [Bacteroidales bacterium]|nr:hypothetical protein [Bacteroidales bacterium]
MNIRLLLVKGIDARALFPLATIIRSYLQENPNVKSIEIGKNEITFSKGLFSSSGHIKYIPYQIICRDGIIFFEGESCPIGIRDNLFTLIANVLRQLQPGYIAKI